MTSMEDRGEFYVQIPASAADPGTIRPQVGSQRRGHQRATVVGSVLVGIAAFFLLSYAFFEFSSLRAASWSTAASDSEVTSKPAPNFLGSQRTAFHFQPLKNWMNDPNGPLYYKGYYHLFYQYNPNSAIWGNITWGHALSKDMIHWEHLDIAMRPDEWYDLNGVWSGSATVLPVANGNRKIFMLYTGSTNASVQVQNLAVPADPTDPLLREWTKSPRNPLLMPPPGIGSKDFRDPTTAWIEPDGLWRIAIGARKGKTGLAMIYKTRDFENWELEEELHAVAETGMWECVDFYPVAMVAASTANSPGLGLDTSVVQASNQLVRHVLKASFDDDKHDYYAIGDYAPATHTWQPVAGSPDVGHGLRYDYGKFYASKSFYDAVKRRRILWGWANESDSETDDVKKGWSSVQTIPRNVYLDYVTGGTSLVQWPIEEVESLRYDRVAANNMVLPGGSVHEVKASGGAQLDIEVRFEYPDVSKLDALPEEYDCSQGGAAHRGVYGPFGLLVLADGELSERTAVYFYLTTSSVGKWETRVCSDQSRSSLAKNLDATVYGTTFKVLPTEKYLSMRVIVDHSIVETFAQGGRACITSRVYPTLALDHDARLFLFNNGTRPVVLHSIAAWKMRAAAPVF